MERRIFSDWNCRLVPNLIDTPVVGDNRVLVGPNNWPSRPDVLPPDGFCNWPYYDECWLEDVEFSELHNAGIQSSGRSGRASESVVMCQ
jgi:hypothetical protein